MRIREKTAYYICFLKTRYFNKSWKIIGFTEQISHSCSTYLRDQIFTKCNNTRINSSQVTKKIGLKILSRFPLHPPYLLKLTNTVGRRFKVMLIEVVKYTWDYKKWAKLLYICLFSSSCCVWKARVRGHLSIFTCCLATKANWAKIYNHNFNRFSRQFWDFFQIFQLNNTNDVLLKIFHCE